MHRNFLMIFILLLLVSCCILQFPILHPAHTSPPFSPTTTLAVIPSSTTATFASTLTPSPVVATLTPSPTSQAPTFMDFYHPDDALYVGDQVSFEVVSPPGFDVKDASLNVQVDSPSGPKFDPVKFGPWGIQGRSEASLIWVWDTKNETPGSHTVTYAVQPSGYSWDEQVTLLPASDMPPDKAAATWAETLTQCCTVFNLTETASERDLTILSTLVDVQAQDAIQKMGSNFTEPITITILPRLLGNGGFSSSEISVSYLDRNYAFGDWALVVHHEMIHAIDGHLGGDFRPTMFVEGLAVFLTGGHYKPEPLMPRAAALLDSYLNWYIPLKPLADDFYASQHEIGYIEGASLIEYMVNKYGLQAFFSFYRDIHNRQGESQSDSIDAALQAHFYITFSQLEQDYLAALKAESDTASWIDDVRLEVTFYDTMRRYQQLLDPSAYFRTAWLLDNKTMREKGIVADYLRHPHTPMNLALETLFITAGQQMSAKDYVTASQTLEIIGSVLDNLDRGVVKPFSVSTMTSDYLAISAALQQQGYEVQKITVKGDTATSNVTTSAGPVLILLHLQRIGGQWSISP